MRILSIILLGLFCLNIYPCQAAESPVNIPEDSIKVLPMVAEQSVSTFLPSSAALGQGLAINIIYPQKPRYKDGAPIAVVIPAGDTPNGLNFCVHAAQLGFVEIRFAFPGGGINSFKSGGYNDYRGLQSQKALRDILLFAAGKELDFRNRSISDLLPIKLATNNIGIVGWSNGGNIALITMEKYAGQLKFINWLALYECPLGSLFFPPSLGSTSDFLSNSHYRQGSAATGHCLIDFRKLAWQSDARQNPGIHKKLGEPELPGVLYFDDNNNHRWDETTEFAFNYCADRGINKKIYPPDVTAAIERLKLFERTVQEAPKKEDVQKKPKSLGISIGKKTNKPVNTSNTINKTEPTTHTVLKWPRTIATLEESENYFQERDGSLAIPDVCDLYPNLLVTIFASKVDHLQTQPDHPHIVLQYNSFLDNNVHWLRLNPESIYLGSMANMNKRNFAQNEPKASIDAESITDYLEPEGVLKDYNFICATIAELADRKRSNNLSSPLTEPIYLYTNGLAVPPLINQTNTEAKSQ